MAILDNLKGIGEIFTGAGKLAKDIREAITGKAIIDPAKQAELEMKLLELEQKSNEAENALMLGQVEINKIEAANPSKFVSGWRPFLGWVLSGCAGIYFLPRFILGMTAWAILAWKVIMKDASTALPILPDMGFGDLIALLGGLLGMATLRSVERAKGVARV